ncbi:MAG: c-type cytochrome [Flavobacteriales bacterium]
MQKFVWLFCVVVLVACGGDAPAPAGTDAPAAAEAQSDDYYGIPASRVKRLYVPCSICHGENGDVSRGGAKLLKESTLSFEERVGIITYGKGTMPPNKDRLEANEIKALAKYIETFRE